ncbi:hypothetical protein EKO23_18875 [Nocardioides guangzhouensis]|uniref:Uncharacterized protein n=1 Tax=Nocardioides guangzhouensis TaxID=2497878 RepID=A0A4Q4Z6S7_9ACTN|nr:hypothetical protein [Nocardioides guangzhouensis]RYP83527.1 hypothetical protein EKO23_18875 [Nocardioides guangzhouensis]
MTTLAVRPAAHRATADRRLPLALAVVAVAAAAPTWLVDDVLTGPAAMNGSARGTAVVVLVIAVPLLVVAAFRDGLATRAVEVGATAYLLYNAVLFCFATPFNRLFLLYVAMLGLAAATLLVLLLRTDPSHLDGRSVPARAVASYLWVVVVLNALVWLSRVVPGVRGDLPPDFLDGTGLTTNPVFVQDLGLWLPAFAWIGYAVWRRLQVGYFLASAGLVFWTVEAVGVAVDQWMGHRADPSSTVVSLAVVPGFVVLAVLSAAMLWLSLRWTRAPGPRAPAPSAPAPRPRS